jgi:hypothetical protein
VAAAVLLPTPARLRAKVPFVVNTGIESFEVGLLLEERNVATARVTSWKPGSNRERE